jgi:hypothetical protein
MANSPTLLNQKSSKESFAIKWSGPAFFIVLILMFLGVSRGLNNIGTEHEAGVAAHAELVRHAQKSEIHQYVVTQAKQCGKVIWKGITESCAIQIVGEATMKSDGAYGDRVKAAIKDLNSHIDKWQAPNAR